MGIVLALSVTATASVAGRAAPIVVDDFEQGRSERWEERRFQGRTEYTAIENGDDYAARVYVVFPHWFAPRTKSLNYI